jgi:hypothetical protein
MPKQLHNVTLVVIDGGAAINLMRRAVIDTLDQISPHAFIAYTPEPLGLGERWIECHAGNVLEATELGWKKLPYDVETSHYLNIEWDAWVLAGELWDPAWMGLDYIGAVWPWHPEGSNIGNGISLRSTKMMRYVAEHDFPVVHPEDDTLCRTYRSRLELAGFRWAAKRQASRFSFEHEPPHPTFMFHAIRNWPHILTEEGYLERLAMANEYVRHRPQWGEMRAIAETVYGPGVHINSGL